MNSTVLIGNLTKDPQLSTTSSGVNYCRFTLAVKRKFAKEGEVDTDFINIVVWRAQAENCAKFLSKGRKVAVCGSIQITNYDAKDGTKRQSFDVVADSVEFLTPNKDNAPEPTPPPERSTKTTNVGDSQQVEMEPISDEDLPF